MTIAQNKVNSPAPTIEELRYITDLEVLNAVDYGWNNSMGNPRSISAPTFLT